MGHAHHFLSRLDRLSLPHVELALALYNDPGLLKYILGQVRVPERAERVAISLDDPKEGPFLIVMREGRFVTCLGRGMSPGEWPIITRGQLDALSARVTNLRERMEACRKLIGPSGGAAQLINRIFEAADELSSEEFAAYAAFQPLFGFEFVHVYYAIGNDMLDARARLVAELRKSGKLRPSWNPVLRAYAKGFWSMGHFAMLAAMSGPSMLEDVPEVREYLLANAFSWPLVRQGIACHVLRGAWCIGKIGKPYLPTYKRGLDEAGSAFTVLNYCVGLGALGLRHARLRAEVQKALASPPAISPQTAVGEFTHNYYKGVSALVELCFEHAEEMAELQCDLGQRMGVKLGETMPEGSPYRFKRPEDVPRELAMRLAVNHISNVIDYPEMMRPTLITLPWVAKAAPEDLLLPRDYVKANRDPWKPEHTYRLLDYFIKEDERKRTERLELKKLKKDEPTRNGPCPCGSEKKFKRCCGAA